MAPDDRTMFLEELPAAATRQLLSLLTPAQRSVAVTLLGYPEDHHCEFLLSFGYPLDPDDLTRPLQSGGRRPLDDVVHEERW